MFKRLTLLWTVVRGDARQLWRALRHPAAPKWLKVGTALIVLYVLSPIDLIPDFIPVLGYADDAIIVTAILRTVVRRAGLPAVRAHWQGTDDGFAALARLTGLSTAQWGGGSPEVT